MCTYFLTNTCHYATQSPIETFNWNCECYINIVLVNEIVDFHGFWVSILEF